jgi:hypothetical protein
MDRGAKAQDYMLDTVVRYRNTLDNSHVSDISRDDICVVPAFQPTGMSAFLRVLLVAVIIIGAGYYLLVRRKKN